MKLKKLISMLLCVCMLASLMPVYAFAEEVDPVEPETPACEHVYEPTETVEATCIAQGYTVYVCSLCGDSYKGDFTSVADHTPEEAAEIPATCAKEGRTAGTVCTVCGEVINGCEPIKKTEHTPIEAAEVPPTCTEAGRTAGHVCEVCGEVMDGCEPIEATGHSPVAVEEVPPEVGKPGTTAGYICETCGEILDGCEPIDALEEETVITIEKQPEDTEPVAGEVVFSVIATVNTETEITHQWQRLDLSIAYATEAEREAAWKDMEGETSAKLHINGLDDEKALTGVMQYVYRCVLAAGEAKVMTKEVHILKPATATRSGTKGIINSGTCGNSLSWTLYDTGSLTITGTGDMTDYPNMAPWNAFTGSIYSIDLGEGITSIGDRAFYGCSRVTEVTIPNGVTRIGVSAFSGCNSVTRVQLPGTLTSIECDFTGYSNHLEVEFGGSLKQWEALTEGRIMYPEDTTLICAYVDGGECGENAAWRLENNGILTITGTGSMADYEQNSAPWNGYISNISGISISTGITRIGNSAFQGCAGVVSVVIPVGVLEIGEHAFASCNNLTDVSIPETVTVIDNHAFHFCIGLSSLTIPESVERLGEYCFSGCNALTSVSIPASITYMGNYAFSGCKGLTSLTLMPGLTRIGQYAFNGCDHLSNLVISNTLSYIEYAAFGGCKSLTTLDIPSGVSQIGPYAFYNCVNITGVTIPSSVKYVGQSAFAGCSELSDVYYDGSRIEWTLINIRDENDCLTSADFHYDQHSWGDPVYTWADDNSTVTASRVCSGNNDHIETETVNTSCETITEPTYTSAGWGEYSASFDNPAFEPQTKQAEIPMLVHEIIASGDCGDNLTWTYDDAGTLTILGSGDMFDYYTVSSSVPWADYRETIQAVLINSGVTSIGNSAFYNCSHLTSISIPDGVTRIGERAFSTCGSLASIFIPSSVTVIGEDAFFYCTNLKSVYISDIAAWCNIDFANSVSNPVVFSNTLYLNGSLLTKLVIPNGITRIKDYAFEECECLTSVTITNGVTSIGTCAFNGCSGITSIAIPESVTSIGNQGLSYCSSLVSVTIPSGMTSIGYSVFNGCSSLVSVTIPASITNISNYSFTGCTSLKDVWYTGTQNQWEAVEIGTEGNVFLTSARIHFGLLPIAFGTCGANLSWTLDNEGTLTISGTGNMDNYSHNATLGWAPWTGLREQIVSVVIEPNVTSIGNMAFYESSSGYSNLLNVSIPDSVTSIGSLAFSGCERLTNIRIPASVSTIGIQAFEFCSSLTSAGPLESNCDYEYGWTTEIPAHAFQGCNGLISVSIPNGVTSIGDAAFLGCSKLTSITLPEGLISIGLDAFCLCEGLTSIEIPENVTGIGASAFKICTNLLSVVIKSNVTSIDGFAFYNCSSLAEVNYGGSQTQWNRIAIGTYNDAIQNASVIYSAYTITFDANGGDGAPEEQTEKKGTTIILTDTTPTLEGYDFLGWSTDPNVAQAEYSAGDEYTREEDITLYAVWKLISYTVTYDANGGEQAPESQTKIPGTTLMLTDEFPVRKGFSFLGWATDPDATVAQYQPGSEYVQDSSITLYAIWTPLTYTVRFAGNGNTGGSTANIQITGDTAETPLPNGFIRAYYTFVSWNTSADGTGESFGESVNTVDLTDYADEQFVITLYAQWELLHYSIAFDANGGEGEMDPQPMQYTFAASLIPNTFTRIGYSFSGWNTKSDGKGAKYADGAIVNNLAAEEGTVVTLYAQWKAYIYSVMFDGNGATSGSMKAQTLTYDKAAALTTNAFKRTNCTFLGWSYEPVDLNEQEKIPAFADKQQVLNLSYNDGDTVTLYAVWAKNCYRIVFNANGGIGDMSEESAWCEYDGSYKLPKCAFTREGFTFEGWATSAKGKVVYIDEQDGIKGLSTVNGKVINLYAMWAVHKYSIEFNGNGATSGTMKPMSNKACGATVTLTANAFKRDGYTFLGWSTDPAAEEPVYPNKAKQANFCTGDGDVLTLFAVWRPTEYSITYKNAAVSDGNYDLNPPAYTIISDTIVLQDLTRPGAVFEGWYLDAKFKTPVTEIPSGSTGAKTVYAKWSGTANAYTIEFHPNGGTGTMKPLAMICGTAKALTGNAFKKDGYTFAGWNTMLNGTGTAYANKESVLNLTETNNGTVWLYAQWTAVEYKITYKNISTFDTNNNPAVYSLTNPVNFRNLNAPLRPGCVFGGWYIDSGFKKPAATADFSSTGAKTLYAKWETSVTYTIAFDANAEGVTGTMKAMAKRINGKDYTLTANKFKRTGYEFLGWSTNPAAEEPLYLDKAKVGNLTGIDGETVTLFAVWKPIEYTITYVNVVDGNVPGKATYTIEETYVLPGPGEDGLIKEGYIFLGWYTTATFKGGTRVYQIGPGGIGNKTLYAKWQQIPTA